MDTLCLNCGTGFHYTGTKIRKFCSRPCYWDVRGRTKTKVCGNCSIEFTNNESSKAKYCSAICKTEAQQNGKSIPPRGKLKTCARCGIQFHRRGSSAKYCTSECYWASRKTGRKPNVRVQVTPKNWDKIKKSVLDRDNRICQKCNAPCPGKGDACVHHIIDREHNELHQLITVCRPCHTQITVVEQALFLLEEQGRDAFAPFVHKLQETK